MPVLHGSGLEWDQALGIILAQPPCKSRWLCPQRSQEALRGINDRKSRAGRLVNIELLRA
jgi:hypothetical protein